MKIFSSWIAWLLVAEGKTCKDSETVTVVDKGKFNSIIDCASACKAKLQNTMFAFGNAKDCKTTGCTCQCIEAESGDCGKSSNEDLTLYKFRGSKMGNMLLDKKSPFVKTNVFYLEMQKIPIY